MDCIFICVFNNKKYVDMLYLLLESIFIYGNVSADTTNILIYTSTPLMNIIKKSHLFDSRKIKFEINNSYNNIDKACKSRLDFFELPSMSKYNRVLYLDTDILVKEDINGLFDLCKEDILYVLEEGSIDCCSDYWGQSLFGDEVDKYNDKTAFTSGILLFNNCEKIKFLFNTVKDHADGLSDTFGCFDQPFIVYNSFKYNLYNNKILKQFVVNNDHNIHSNKVVHHFPGGPGIHQYKLHDMNIFLNAIKDQTIVTAIDKAKSYIDEYLLPIINECGEPLEGNIFMLHHQTHYTDDFINKRKNLSNLVLNKNIENIMEIGFNSGFSSLLFLLTNPKLHITCLDLGEHKYTIPCYKKIKETFGERITLIIGDSRETIKIIKEGVFDLIHIDGGHSTEVATSDIIHSYRLSKSGTILIFDDYNFNYLAPIWDTYINTYELNNLNINIYDCIYHDIKYVESKC